MAARKPRARKPAASPRRRSAPRRGRGNRTRRIVLGLVLTLFGVIAASGVQYYRSPSALGSEPARLLVEALPTATTHEEAPTAPGFVVAHVRRVVDGDTIEVEIAGKKEKVRLLNVDTPESVHSDRSQNTALGRDAAVYTRRRLENAQVRLQADSADAYDRFGRRLAYVFLEGENFNEELIREGFSEYYTKYGKSPHYDRDFRRAEEEARSKGIGVWTRELAGAP